MGTDKYNGNGQQALDQQGITTGRDALGAVRPSQTGTDADRIGRSIRIGLTSIMFHYRDLSPVVCNWLGAATVFR